MSKSEPQIQPGTAPRRAAVIPWDSKSDWDQANAALQHLHARHQAALEPVREIARDLKRYLESVFPVLDSLCKRTCPACQAPCCHSATVWFDFKDLVFMHLNDLTITAAQLNRPSAGICCHCGPTGCRLPRLNRPWTCTWYLCPPQKSLLTDMPGKRLVQLEEKVAAIKHLRKEMEAEFIRLTS